MSGVLIAGAGLAGARCAERLRSGGYPGRIRMIGEEPVPPYRRPALSKELLAGAAGLGELRLRSPDWWKEAGIELELGRRVERIDVDRRRATLQGGSELGWDTLVVATGSRARALRGVELVRGDVADAGTVRDAVAAGIDPVVLRKLGLAKKQARRVSYMRVVRGLRV